MLRDSSPPAFPAGGDAARDPLHPATAEVVARVEAMVWWMQTPSARAAAANFASHLTPEALARAALQSAKYDIRTYGPEGTLDAIRRRGREAVLVEARRARATAAATHDGRDQSRISAWDAEAWLDRWLDTPLSALDGRAPRPHLDWEGPGGHELLSKLIRTGVAATRSPSA